jgi:hypothetical protein
MLRRWALAAAGVGLLVMIAIATAPRPTCHCTGHRGVAERAPTPTVVVKPAHAACSTMFAETREVIHQQLALARELSTPPRDAYLYLMGARALDCAGDYAAEIDVELARVAPRAAVGFLARKDYQNAASAVMVASNLGTANATTRSVEQILARTPYPRD